jgi:predicted RNase H-like nuclease
VSAAIDPPVAGADGCRSGWVVATACIDGRCVTVEVVAHMAPVIGAVRCGSLRALGVDMPIGLPERPGRAADREARALLSPRGMTVFPTPARALVSAPTYAEANQRSKALFGTGLTKQTFNLFVKIRELDAHVGPGDAVVEIHPECSFATMAGGVLPPKRTREGVAARIEALTESFEDVAGIVAAVPRSVAGADDVLDALAVLWSTRRYATNRHIELGDGGVDARSLPMRIVC